MSKIAGQLKAVLCDPEGTPCVDGSPGDMEVISEAIEAVERLEVYAAVIRDELIARAPVEDGARRVGVGHLAWLNFLMAIEGKPLTAERGDDHWENLNEVQPDEVT